VRVAFCWPFNNEPDLRPLIESWIISGKPGFTALLPVVRAPRSALGFRAWTPGCAMMTDSYGIPTPAEGEFIEPQALLIPANGFDSAGYRIGYGGGFFDRTLAALGPATLSIGVGFELARLDSIHPQAHDIPLHAIVTEAGVFRPARQTGHNDPV
jgi:5,10-methenyltetrahydrofolate synthetase